MSTFLVLYKVVIFSDENIVNILKLYFICAERPLFLDWHLQEWLDYERN